MSSPLELQKELKALREKLAEMEGAAILDKNAIRLQREDCEEAKAELAAQKELHATTAAQLADSQEKLNEAIDCLSKNVIEVAEERDSFRKKFKELVQVAERYGWNGVDNSKHLATFLDSELGELAKRRSPRCQREECARERQRVDALEASLRTTLQERPSVLDSELVALSLRAGVRVNLLSLDRITVGGLLTLVKLTGSGVRINGAMKPEGWPFVICVAVGSSPGNVAAVEVLQRFDAEMQALGAPLVMQSMGE